MSDQPPPEDHKPLPRNYPDPPPFWKQFTPANLALVESKQLPKGAEGNDQDAAARLARDEQLRAQLPPSARLLVPPPPPADEQFTTYGETFSAKPQPTPVPVSSDPPPQDFLIRTTRKIMLHYLHLTNALALNTELAAADVDELSSLFKQAHTKVNEYRPHQAREGLIAMMEERLERSKREVARVKEMEARVDEVVAGLHEVGEEALASDGLPESDTGKDKQNGLWETLQAIKLDSNGV